MRNKNLPQILVLFCTVSLFFLMVGGGVALAQSSWVDEIGNSITHYQSLYPSSNFDPYEQQLTLVKKALSKGNQKSIRTEMSKWFKMLRKRAYGIDGMAAEELFNFAVMVTPVQEYNISVPR